MAGQWLLSDVMHIPGGGLGFLVAGGVVMWLGRSSKPRFMSPTSVDGWLNGATQFSISLSRSKLINMPMSDDGNRCGLLLSVRDHNGWHW